MSYRFKLTCFKSSEKNRLQNCFTVSNIQLGNVVSDTFGKSVQTILDKLLENPADASFDLEPLIYRSLKNKIPQLQEDRKEELKELIFVLATPYQQKVVMLQAAPGIGSDFTAIRIISEIGINMEAFLSAKYLCSYVGLILTNNEITSRNLNE